MEKFSADQILEARIPGTTDPAIEKRVRQVQGQGGPSPPAAQRPLGHFLDALASGDPTPGGGAASALLGAVGASLAAMGCRLTDGKAEFDVHRPRLRQIEARADSLREKFTASIDEDVRAYNAVLEALRLPKGTVDEKAQRSAVLQKAFQWATEVPLEVAQMAAETLDLLEELARTGLKSAISDVGVGGKAARAAFDGGRYNVLINLGSIKDATFVAQARSRLSAAQVKADRHAAALDAAVAAELH
jgi:glutamate formiminotransferase/formiminotetrahydrofolate cyclodeaminase